MKKWFFLLMAIVLILTENGKVSASIEGEAIDIANETVLTTEEKDKIVEAIMNLLDASTSVRKRGEINVQSMRAFPLPADAPAGAFPGGYTQAH